MVKRNIYLAGFMGTGKSTIARELARIMGRKNIDIDQYLERQHGMSISAMFTKYGEAWFRQREEDLCLKLAENNNRVIAAGGGTLMNPRIFQAFQTSGLLVCLYAQRDCLLERLSRNHKRPLLQGGNLGEKVDKLLSERQWLYDKISIRVDTSNMTPLETARKIAELLQTRQKILEKLRDQYIDLS